MRNFFLLLLCALLVAFPSSAVAAAKHTREGFALQANGRPTLLVVFASLRVYAYDDNGQAIRSPTWEAAAEANVVQYLSSSSLASAFDPQFVAAQTTQSTPQYQEFLNHFNDMTAAVLFQVPMGTFSAAAPQNNPDGSRIRALRGRHTYAFDPAFLTTHLGDVPMTDYILFIQTEDGHRSADQYAADLVTAALDGDPNVGIRQTPHVGNFVLVDRRTGSVEWYFGDGRIEGDIRTAQGAERKFRVVLRELMRLRAG